ncbi:MFS transporter [Chloroflexota bacterium]
MLAHFGHHVIAALLQPLLPFIRDDFGLDYTQAGLMVSAFTLAYGVSHLPAGWLADRIGARVLITVGISGVALSGLIVGLSPTYFVMLIFLVLMGVMGGGYHPAASPLVSESVAPERRGQSLGIHQIGGTFSYFLTPLLAAGISVVIGWRGTFISLAIPVTVFGIVLYLLLGRRDYGGKTEDTEPSKADGTTQGSPGRLRWLVAFVTLGVFLQVSLFSVSSMLTLFAVDNYRVSEGTAAILLAFYHSGGIWAGPLGGHLSDRIGKVPVMLVLGFVASPALYLMGIMPFGWSIYAVLMLMGAAQYMGMPISESYIISHTSERNRSSVLGIYYFTSRGGPGILVPLIGYLFDEIGFSTSFTVLGASLFIIFLTCSIFLWKSQD